MQINNTLMLLVIMNKNQGIKTWKCLYDKHLLVNVVNKYAIYIHDFVFKWQKNITL